MFQTEELSLGPGQRVAACVPYKTRSGSIHKRWILATIRTRSDNRFLVEDLDPGPDEGTDTCWTLSADMVKCFPCVTSRPPLTPEERVLSLWYDNEGGEWSTMFYEARVVYVPDAELVAIRFKGIRDIFEVSQTHVLRVSDDWDAPSPPFSVPDSVDGRRPSPPSSDSTLFASSVATDSLATCSWGLPPKKHHATDLPNGKGNGNGNDNGDNNASDLQNGGGWASVAVTRVPLSPSIFVHSVRVGFKLYFLRREIDALLPPIQPNCAHLFVANLCNNPPPLPPSLSLAPLPGFSEVRVRTYEVPFRPLVEMGAVARGEEVVLVEAGAVVARCRTNVSSPITPVLLELALAGPPGGGDLPLVPPVLRRVGTTTDPTFAESVSRIPSSHDSLSDHEQSEEDSSDRDWSDRDRQGDWSEGGDAQTMRKKKEKEREPQAEIALTDDNKPIVDRVLHIVGLKTIDDTRTVFTKPDLLAREVGAKLDHLKDELFQLGDGHGLPFSMLRRSLRDPDNLVKFIRQFLLTFNRRLKTRHVSQKREYEELPSGERIVRRPKVSHYSIDPASVNTPTIPGHIIGITKKRKIQV